MDKDFAKHIDYINEQGLKPPCRDRNKQILKFMEDICFGEVLDIGERNYFTKIIEDHFDIMIDSTNGDLDEILVCPKKQYDTVICSHVLEHLFNPLLCLENIKKVMKPGAKIVIAIPIKPHFITWGKGHFHEMDEYRSRKLIDRAGFTIERLEKFTTYHWHSLKCYTGIMPFIRLFFKEQGYIICKK